MLDKDWLSTCAPVGVFDSVNKSWKPIGAGVFVYDDPFIWYVTANHIVRDTAKLPLQVLIGHAKEKRYLVDIGSMHQQNKIEWLIDEKNDLAATLFPANPDFILKAIGFPFFLDSKDLLPSMSCYSVGCPYGLAGFDLDKMTTCVLDGIISGINEPQARIYVTVPTFPGNSGGPLLVYKQPFHPNGDCNIGEPTVFLGGIISMYQLIEYQEKPNGHSIPPLHLGVVIPCEAIRKLLTSSNSTQMKEKIRTK